MCWFHFSSMVCMLWLEAGSGSEAILTRGHTEGHWYHTIELILLHLLSVCRDLCSGDGSLHPGASFASSKCVH